MYWHLVCLSLIKAVLTLKWNETLHMLKNDVTHGYCRTRGNKRFVLIYLSLIRNRKCKELKELQEVKMIIFKETRAKRVFRNCVTKLSNTPSIGGTIRWQQNSSRSCFPSFVRSWFPADRNKGGVPSPTKSMQGPSSNAPKATPKKKKRGQGFMGTFRTRESSLEECLHPP